MKNTESQEYTRPELSEYSIHAEKGFANTGDTDGSFEPAQYIKGFDF